MSKLSLKDPENTALSKTALEIYLKFNKYCEAMFVALQLNEDELIEDIFTKCSDLSMRKQLSYILGRQQRFLELGEDIAEAEELQGRIKNIFSSDQKFLKTRKKDDLYFKSKRYLLKTVYYLSFKNPIILKKSQ